MKGSYLNDPCRELRNGEYGECEHGIPDDVDCASCLKQRYAELDEELLRKDEDRLRLRKTLEEFCCILRTDASQLSLLAEQQLSFVEEDIKLSKWHDNLGRCKECNRPAVAPCYSCWASLCEECLNEITGDHRTYCDSCLEGDRCQENTLKTQK